MKIPFYSKWQAKRQAKQTQETSDTQTMRPQTAENESTSPSWSERFAKLRNRSKTKTSRRSASTRTQTAATAQTQPSSDSPRPQPTSQQTSSQTSFKIAKSLPRLPQNKLLRNKTVLFIVLALIQLAVPFYLAQSWNAVLAEGDTFRFALKASAPPEVKYGRYASLNPTEDHGPIRGGQVKLGDTVYAAIDKSNSGMANVIEVTPEPPEVYAYIAAKVVDIRGGEAYLSYPFSDYYLSDEEAERLQIESLKSRMNYTVTVKVKKGSAVAERLNFNQ